MSMLNRTPNKDSREDVSAVDELVFGVLTAGHRAFESVVIAAGISDATAVRQSLLRLLDAGKAEQVYGLGWRRVEGQL